MQVKLCFFLNVLLQQFSTTDDPYLGHKESLQ